MDASSDSHETIPTRGASYQILKLDKENGRIMFPTGRAFILGMESWSGMKAAVLSQPGGMALIHEFALAYGRSVGSKMFHTLGRENDMILNTLQETAREAGWGVLKVEGDKLYGTHLRIELSDCVFCECSKPDSADRKRGACPEFAGIVEGVLDVMYGKRAVIETACSVNGSPHCEFEVRQ